MTLFHSTHVKVYFSIYYFSPSDLLSESSQSSTTPATAAATTTAHSSSAAYSKPGYMMTTQTAGINPAALLQFNSSKDSRWLTLEVCREYQRNRCTRTEEECKFAHPPPHVDQQNGRVMCCFDSIKVSMKSNQSYCSRKCWYKTPVWVKGLGLTPPDIETRVD